MLREGGEPTSPSIRPIRMFGDIMRLTRSMPVAALMVAALGLVGAGCGAQGSNDETVPAADKRSNTQESHNASGPIRVVAKRQQADLHLFVSNQSFVDDPVELTISIDSIEVIAESFDVGGQHNFVLFPLKVPPGRHTITAVSDTGVRMRQHFTLPETGRRYASVFYWNSPSRHIDWQIQARPMAFA